MNLFPGKTVSGTALAVLFGLALLALPCTGTVTAADGHSHDHAGHDHAGHDHAGHSHSRDSAGGGHNHPEVIAFRMRDWKELHFNDPQKAEGHVQALRRLGCEARLDQHAGHTDVVFRNVEWKQITVESHAAAGRWEQWLKNSGFDVWHGHIDERLLHGPEAVEFRQTEWKTLHFDGERARDQQQITTALKQLGCDVRQERHGDHDDVTFRCPVWSTIRVEDHTTAERWMTWLKGAGFENRHTHPPSTRQSRRPDSDLR